MKSFRALFWKEYRQQAVLVVALIALCFLLQLSATLMHLWNNFYPLPYFTIAMLTTALYAAGASSIVFAREHEERTFMILRSLPISGPFLAWSKIAWLLASIFVTGLLTALIAAPWALAMSDSSSTDIVFGACGVGVIEGLCWGLFWSPRTKSQLNALLCTFFSVAIGMQICTSLYVYVYQIVSPSSPGIYAEAAWFRLVLAIPVGVIGLYSALNWLMKQDTQPLVDTTGKVKSQSRGTLAKFPFLSLCWITLRQSPTLILTGWIVSLLSSTWIVWDILRGVLSTNKWSPYGQDNLASETAYTLAIILPLFLVVYCGSVFFTDQKEKGTRLLAHCGVSPRKIWWSRILVFGSALVPLVIASIVIGIVGYSYFHWKVVISLIFGYNQDFYYSQDWITPVTPRMTYYYIFMLFTMMFFCVGQMVSLFLRSGVVAIVVTGMAGLVLVLICAMFLGFFGLNVVWTILPIPILCLVASRLRVGDWLRGRDTLRIWFKPLLVVLIPLVCVCIVIPFARIYSVPNIDLGYRMDSSALQAPRHSNRNDDLNYSIYNEIRLRRHAFDNRAIADALLNIHKTMTDQAQRDGEKGAKRSDALKKYIEMLENEPRNWYNQWGSDPRSLLELNSTFYTYSEQIVRTGIIPNEQPKDMRRTTLNFMVALPWERTRFLKLNNIQFQNTSQSITLMEKAIYDKTFNFEDAIEQTRLAQRWGGGYARGGFDAVSCNAMYYIRADGSTVFEIETQRRLTLLDVALQLWWKEHGSLPESLDELQGVYLKEIPKVPGFEMPFVYRPDPMKFVQLDQKFVYSLGSKSNKNVPYLFAPIPEKYERVLETWRYHRFLHWAKPVEETSEELY